MPALPTHRMRAQEVHLHVVAETDSQPASYTASNEAAAWLAQERPPVVSNKN